MRCLDLGAIPAVLVASPSKGGDKNRRAATLPNHARILVDEERGVVSREVLRSLLNTR